MPDLKKMLTLEALSEALPSWLKRSTKPEYNADEIDSTLTTNQFVTASDKENWNAKGTYSKPSGGIPKSDLSSIVQASLEKADSALQSETDPTVPSWAKQTNKPSYTQDEVADGTTYKRVTQTEKNAWSGKQNALSTTQMQAVNSGITSEKVGQISTNQTNILYAINTGVKNELDNRGVTSYTHNGITYTFNKDGSVTLKGTASGNSVFYYFVDGYVYIPNNWKGHILSGVTSGSASTYSLTAQYSNNGTSWATEANCITEPITIASNYNYINFSILVRSGVTVDTTIYPMLCDPTVWAQSHDFMPPALPNSDLTYLEAEDRASLIEVVDSGAKNELQPSWTTQTINGVTFTVGSDGVITATTTGTRTSAAIYPLLSRYSGTKMAGKVMSISPKGGTNASYYVAAEQADSPWHNVGTDYGDGVVISSEANNKNINVNIVIPANYSPNNLKFYPMICTLADWNVSHKYVPHRMPYGQALTLLNQKAPSGVADYVASGSVDDLPSGCALCGFNVTGKPISDNYFIIRTRIYDANCAEQEAIAPAGNRRFNRTKWGGTWTSWAEYTKIS